MEEKLYFKPESSSKIKSHRLRNSVIFLLVLIMIIVIIILLLRGRITTSGSHPNPIETQSLTCDRKGEYPKITKASSNNNSEVSITSVFSGITSLKSISLNYTANYESESEVSGAEAVTHFEFGEGLAQNNLTFTEFDNKFSIFKDKLVVSVYGGQNDISSAVRATYFMIDIEKYGIPKTLKDYQTIYEEQGFKCFSSEDN